MNRHDGLESRPADDGDAFAGQVQQVLRRAVHRVPDERRADRLAAASAGLLGVDVGGVSVLLAPQMSVPVGISDAGAEVAERLQFSVGEGPCWAAYETGVAVLVDDVAGSRGQPGPQGPWPAWAAAVLRSTPFRGVVSLPLRSRLGVPVVLNLYSRARLSGRVADAGALAVLARGAGEVLDGTGGGGASRPLWLDSSSTRRRSQVWVAEELVVRHRPALDVAAALRAMRTYCAVQGGTVDEVADALVRGRLTAAEVLGR